MAKLCNDRGGRDKWLHLFLSIIIGGIIAGLLSLIPWPSPWIPAIITLCAVMAVGILKEVRDSRQRGNHFCAWDLLADIVGAVLTAALAWAAAYWS